MHHRDAGELGVYYSFQVEYELFASRTVLWGNVATYDGAFYGALCSFSLLMHAQLGVGF